MHQDLLFISIVFGFLLAGILTILGLAIEEMKPNKLDNPDVAIGLQKQKKKRCELGKAARFFVGEPVVAESRRDESPYELADDVWMAPENAPACIAAQQMEAYDLPDKLWTAPFITVEGYS